MPLSSSAHCRPEWERQRLRSTLSKISMPLQLPLSTLALDGIGSGRAADVTERRYRWLARSSVTEISCTIHELVTYSLSNCCQSIGATRGGNMAERLTGWHPDPWAVHELRYFSMSGTPTRLVKDGMKASYDAPPNDAPTTPTAPLSPTPALNETKNEPTSAEAISDLLAHLMRSAHRKLAVAEMENDPGRVGTSANRSSSGKDWSDRRLGIRTYCELTFGDHSSSNRCWTLTLTAPSVSAVARISELDKEVCQKEGNGFSTLHSLGLPMVR